MSRKSRISFGVLLDRNTRTDVDDAAIWYSDSDENKYEGGCIVS